MAEQGSRRDRRREKGRDHSGLEPLESSPIAAVRRALIDDELGHVPVTEDAMRFRASVSFESDTQPVRTYRGEISAGSCDRASSLAVKAARRACPNARWRSLVVVLEKLEQVDVAEPAAIDTSTVTTAADDGGRP
jgi:hypothetical protein